MTKASGAASANSFQVVRPVITTEGVKEDGPEEEAPPPPKRARVEADVSTSKESLVTAAAAAPAAGAGASENDAAPVASAAGEETAAADASVSADGAAAVVAAPPGEVEYECGRLVRFTFEAESVSGIEYRTLKAGLGGREEGIVYVEYEEVCTSE